MADQPSPLNSPPRLLPRGAYIAPHLDEQGRRIVLLIDRRHRCAHSLVIAHSKTEEEAIQRAAMLLEALDPPRTRETA
jgi:hypothetical protein